MSQPKPLKITILGCGNSTGVPAVTNYWGDCDPNEPKNRRRRCSIAVQDTNNKNTLIIDTGPDFREQMNAYNITQINGVLYTHEHADHMHGIDDLRFYRFKQGDLIPTFMSQSTMDAIRGHFGYMFDGGNWDIYKPILTPNIVKFGEKHSCSGIEFIPFAQDHGSCISTGYRFGELAYSVDLITLDDTAIETLKGIKTWIVDAAGYHNDNNKVHATIENIIALNDKIGAETIYLTSLSLGMDYKTLCDELPPYIKPCFDGLAIESP